MPIQLEDDGFVQVVIDQSEVSVDVYAVYNRLLEIDRQAESTEADSDGAAGAPPVPVNQRIVELIDSLGFPRVSHRAGVRFAEAIFAHVGELRKKDASAPSPSTSAD